MLTIRTCKVFSKALGEYLRQADYYAEGMKGLNTDPAGSMHTEVLDFIAWRDEARAMLMRDFARIARIYTAGCVLDTAEVNAAEKELHDAFWAEDKVRFTRAVRQWRLACYRAIRGQWEGAEP